MPSIGNFKATFIASVDGFLKPMRDVADSIGNSQKQLKSFASDANSLGKKMEVISAPFQAIGVAALAASADIKSAMNVIRVGTGATGEALAGLKNDFKAVFANTPESAKEVGAAIAELNQRLGLTGKPLQEMSEQLLTLSRITGTEVKPLVADAARLFNSWKIATEDQSQALDFLFKVSQSTGVGIQQLSEQIVSSGAALRNMGFSFKQSAVLIGQFEKAGVDTTGVMASLKKAFAEMSKAGITDTNQALTILVDRIKNAGTAAQGNAEAIKVFGARAGGTMADAIRQGRFEVSALVDQLNKSKDTIKSAGEDTLGFAGQMQILRHQVEEALEPLGRVMMKTLKETVVPLLKDAAGELASLGEAFEKLSPTAQTAILGVGAALAGLGPGLFALGGVATGIREIIAAGKALAGLQIGANIAAAFSSLQLIGMVKNFGDLNAAISLIGQSSLVAKLGMIGLAAGIGVAVGQLVNWAIEGTKVRAIMDDIARSVGSWLFSGQIAKATKQGADAEAQWVAVIKQHGIAVDEARLGDSAYRLGLTQQVAAMEKAKAGVVDHAKAMKGTGETAEQLAAKLAAIGQKKDALVQFRAEVDKLKAQMLGVLGDDKPSKAFITALRELDGAGKLNIDTVRKLKDELDKYRNSTDPLILKLREELLVDKMIADANLLQADALENLTKVKREAANVRFAPSAFPEEPPTAPPPAFDRNGAFRASIDDINKRVKDTSEQIVNMHRLPEEVIASVRELSKQGFSNAEIIATMGDEIEKTANISKQFGIPLDANTKLLLKQVQAAKQAQQSAEDLRNAWSVAMGQMSLDFARSIKDIILHGNGLKSLVDIAKKTADSMFEAFLVGLFNPLTNAMAKLGRSLADSLTSVLFGGGKKGVGIGGLLGAGESGVISKLLPKGLAAALGIGGTAAALSGTAIAGTAGTIALTSGPAAGLAIASAPMAIGGVAGTTAATGTAAAGAGAGGLGASIGAFATNPITIGVAAALAAGLLIKKFVGAGRKTANTFVQNVQNPFDQAFAGIVDPITAARSAGTLKLADVQKAQAAINDLVTNFRQAEAAFAAQGKNELKVGNQALATENPKISAIQSSLMQDLTNLNKGPMSNGRTGPGMDKPQTINAPFNFAPVFNVTVEGADGLTDLDVRDGLMPKVTTVLETGVRGYREKWQQLLSTANSPGTLAPTGI